MAHQTQANPNHDSRFMNAAGGRGSQEAPKRNKRKPKESTQTFTHHHPNIVAKAFYYGLVAQEALRVFERIHSSCPQILHTLCVIFVCEKER